MASANVLRAVAIRRVSAYETDGGTWAGHGIALQSMLPALGNPQPMRCINSDMNPSLLAYRLSYVGATVDSYIAFGPAIDLLGRENDSSVGTTSSLMHVLKCVQASITNRSNYQPDHSVRSHLTRGKRLFEFFLFFCRPVCDAMLKSYGDATRIPPAAQT